MQQTSHNLGHSKHRKAFGSKLHKSALNRILLQKDENQKVDEKKKLKDAKKPPMFKSVSDLMKGKK